MPCSLGCEFTRASSFQVHRFIVARKASNRRTTTFCFLQVTQIGLVDIKTSFGYFCLLEVLLRYLKTAEDILWSRPGPAGLCCPTALWLPVPAPAAAGTLLHFNSFFEHLWCSLHNGQQRLAPALLQPCGATLRQEPVCLWPSSQPLRLILYNGQLHCCDPSLRFPGPTKEVSLPSDVLG